MHQLGTAFVNSWLIPEIKNILRNVDKDPRLQKIFKTQETVESIEKTALVNTHFTTANNDFQYNFRYREIFFDELIDFVDIQKKICGDNLGLMALRILPVAKKIEQVKEKMAAPIARKAEVKKPVSFFEQVKEKMAAPTPPQEEAVFTNVAEENISKFAFWVVKSIEKDLIKDRIEKKKMNGEFSSPEQAEKDLKALAEGKLIWIRKKKKGAEFDYANIDEIKKLIELTKDIDEFFTEDGDKGRKMFGFTSHQEPAEEMTKEEVVNTDFGDTYLGLKAQANDNVRVESEKMLEKSGLYLYGSMKVDQNGYAEGIVEDMDKQKMKVNVDLNAPTLTYRFTFLADPAKFFDLTKDEIDENFKKDKLPAYAVWAKIGILKVMKQNYAQPAPAVLSQPAAAGHATESTVTLPETQTLGQMEMPSMQALSYQLIQEAAAKENQQAPGQRVYGQTGGYKRPIGMGAMHAKKALAARKKEAETEEMPQAGAGGEPPMATADAKMPTADTGMNTPPMGKKGNKALKVAGLSAGLGLGTGVVGMVAGSSDWITQLFT